MQRFSNLTDLLSPLIAFLEWSPVITTLIFIAIVVIVYLKWWPTWKTLKRLSYPAIFALIAFSALVVFGFIRFMSFLTLIPIAIECRQGTLPTVVPPDGRIYMLSLNAI